jgi:hypothetical protein
LLAASAEGRKYLLKILGIALLCLSGFGTALLLVGREEQRLSVISALAELLEAVKRCVENYSMSASEILRACDKELLLRCGYQGEDIPQGFLDMSGSCRIPHREAATVFEEFASDFGKNCRGMQTEKCAVALARMRDIENGVRAQLPGRKKVLICGSGSFALIIIILLL